ncbi:hypothetical protein GA0115255_1057514 [Streptomyces sp. Ncost-T6T-2b]|nr:hypothetical protein GA0115255_1057514 [Streptomyces sp. Ncost-T6T-2b]
MRHGLAGPGQFGPQRGDCMPLHRRTTGKADVQQLAHGRPGAVAADQITPAPPGRSRLPGVHRDAVAVLLQGVDPAQRHQPDQRFLVHRRTQRGAQLVLRQVQRCGEEPGERLTVLVRPAPTQRHLPDQLLPAHRTPARPAQPDPVQLPAAEAVHQVRGVLAQHDRAGGPGLLRAGALVEEDRRDALGGEGQRQRQADGPGADDDHRVHSAYPPALTVMRNVAEVAGCVITERMQPTGGACVK